MYRNILASIVITAAVAAGAPAQAQESTVADGRSLFYESQDQRLERKARQWNIAGRPTDYAFDATHGADCASWFSRSDDRDAQLRIAHANDGLRLVLSAEVVGPYAALVTPESTALRSRHRLVDAYCVAGMSRVR